MGITEYATPSVRAKFEAHFLAFLCRDLGNSSLKKILRILNLASCFRARALRRIGPVVGLVS
jgi:hypothetical protein